MLLLVSYVMEIPDQVGDDVNQVGDDVNQVGDDVNQVGDDVNQVGDDVYSPQSEALYELFGA